MKISVIVPVYNVENYIRRCVESILQQKYQEFELLLIDDGSKDSSGYICDEYEKRDERIRVIHKENGGLSDARNVGIFAATGEFVTYIDSDDYVSDEYLTTLLQVQQEGDYDIVCASFTFFSDENDDIFKNTSSGEKTIYSGVEACKALLLGELFTSSCNMVIRKSIAEKSMFPVGKYHEDEFTTFRYFLSAQKICKINKNLYFYYQREGSIIHSFGKAVLDEIEAADNYCIVCADVNNDLLKAANKKKYSMFLQILRDYPQIKNSYVDHYRMIIEYIKQYRWYIILKSNESKIYKIKTIIKMLIRKY